MKHLPLAIVRGSVASIRQAVTTGAAHDVYPDEHIQLLDTASSDSMGAAFARSKTFTGKGVTVAVVDSGCDASHKDLADHVVHNVKLVGGEYLNQRPNPSPSAPGDGAFVVPIEQSPYQNSDLGSGHGTHVSGIIAADGTTSPDHLGVAPDASLVCYSIGEVLFTTAVVSAYDHMIDHPEWGIDVVNNSWGNSYRPFDPNDPVNVATKYVADRNVVVVFAAGNSGTENAELSLNPFSEAPWVLSVAASTVAAKPARGDFSSNGAEFDNSTTTDGAVNGGVAQWNFTGSRIGVYHPDITTPGVDISSTCDTIGVAVGPCPPDSNETASGTSMASPHAAGAAAVLLQANPKLKVAQVQQALQATARPVLTTEGDKTAGFWQVGYGFVDLQAAINLVRRADYATAIPTAQKAADARVLKSTPWKVNTSNVWSWAAPTATVQGVPDTKSFTVNVLSTTKAIKVALAYPSLGSVAINGMSYTATVTDAAGKVVGTTTANFWNGSSSLFVDLRTVQGLKYGTFTIAITGDRAASDPDTLDSDSAMGRMVTAQFAQLQGQ
jgi:serine protease AprX